MVTITDEFMRQMASQARAFSLMILKDGPNRHMTGAPEIIWEHGRRNHALRAEGILSIVCPVSDGSTLCGIGVFNASLEEVKQIMDEDPGVKQGIFIYELHACRGFPGDNLPKT